MVDAFHESGGLILIRGQSRLTPRELAGFAALFGELEENEKYDPDFLLPGHPEILRIGNLRENGTYRSLFTRADRPPLLWHCDDSFREPQPLGSCILCVETYTMPLEKINDAFHLMHEGESIRSVIIY